MEAKGAARRGGAATAAAVAVAATGAAGAMLAVAGAVAAIGADRESQTAAYILAFAVVLPLAALLAHRSSVRDEPLSATTGLLTFALVPAVLLPLRLAGEAGVPETPLRAAEIILGLAVAGTAAFVALGPPGSWPRRVTLDPRPLALAGAVVAIACAIPFLPASVGVLGTIVAIVAALLAARFAPELADVRLPRPLVACLDAALLLLVVLIALDLTGYWGEDVLSVTKEQRPGTVGPLAAVHQNYFLGPVTDVLHGRALLVEADSVYGIGTAYAIAGWFLLVPIGHGTFTLFGGVMTALMIAAGWLILRAARVPLAIRAAAVVLSLMVVVLCPISPPTLFSNIGAVRFGPPLFLLVALVLAARRGDRPTSWSPAGALVLAVFSIWSIEALVYCAGVWLAVVLAEMLAAGGRAAAVRLAGRALATAAAALVAVHVVFALATLVFAGDLPDWGMYVSLFRAWSEIVSDFFNFPIQPWSMVWGVGAVYVLSGIGLVSILLSRRQSPPPEAIVAIAGLVGGGIGTLSYLLTHPLDFFLLHLAYPAILLVAIWSALALRGGAAVPIAPWRRASAALAAFVAVAVFAGALSGAREKAPRTALAHLVPGGPSFAEDWELMWDSAPVDERAVATEELIEEHFPGDEALVLTEPDLGMEALMRSGRANRLPSSYPPNDEVDLSHSLPPVEEEVAELEPGDLMLTQAPQEPGEEVPFSLSYQQLYGSTPSGSRLGPLARLAHDAIEERFRLVPVDRGPDGITVVRLEPR